MENKEVISKAEMIGKIVVATEARGDSDFVVVARTDGRAVEGIESAIGRAKAYRAAGADMLFVEAPGSIEEIEMIAAALPAPQPPRFEIEARAIGVLLRSFY
jgi:2-methylisocitrate lyase-like PEP mutase family enzyme